MKRTASKDGQGDVRHRPGRGRARRHRHGPLGAGWAGARSMTATSGPGISLMSEFIGLGYFAEIPGVIWDIQRWALHRPADPHRCRATFSLPPNSHGDTQHGPDPLLVRGVLRVRHRGARPRRDAPDARLRPSDLDLGMNNWMSDPFPYPEKPFDRGKVLEGAGSSASREVGRATSDVDGDGDPLADPPRTDHPMAAYFTRGSGHDEVRPLHREAGRLRERTSTACGGSSRTARTRCRGRWSSRRDGAKIGFIAYGTTDFARPRNRATSSGAGAGNPDRYLRLRACRLTEEVFSFVGDHERVYVVEQNRDGQMADLIRLELGEEQGKIRKSSTTTGSHSRPFHYRCPRQLEARWRVPDG
jgi:2-oxoglutarate/2-oxoacid ferredoxin oxidoreductase subunit alpha